ncbi:MAG: ATP-binding protein [Desulfobacteraceae bacterium]|nr:ATP-binding protein [Desulfobacteraceae bacterium]
MEKFLPVGIQIFEQMIRGNFYYVDKTRYIYEMVRPPQGFYFLARPRRFGKSLTVSTLENLFRGNKDLFRGLWIEQTDWEWKPHPVIKIDFSAIGLNTDEVLENDLILHVRTLAENNGISLPGSGSLSWLFTNLIVNLSKKYQERVVVLMDEYDKPIIQHIGRGEEHLKIAKANRDKLKQFFGVLKGADVSAALRFVFITGISKFARVSIFSDLNNLNDISMQEKYDAILGYTEDELRAVFQPEISRLADKELVKPADLLKKIGNWYNGYRFTESETKVCNPFSLVKLFDVGKFDNYWFETATPTFLMNLIQEQNYPLPDIETLILEKEAFSVYELENPDLEPLLFQTGYLTIRHFDDHLYHLGYPNREVKTSFLSYLYRRMIPMKNRSLQSAHKRLQVCLNEKKIDDFIAIVRSIMANIPYVQIANQDEAYYHTVFYLMLSSSGVDVDTEVLSSMGRLDMKAEFSDKIYIIELKCDLSSDKAVEQILKKRYYEQYLHSGKDIYLMGISFDKEKRTVEDYKWGTLREFLTDSSVPG